MRDVRKEISQREEKSVCEVEMQGEGQRERQNRSERNRY